MPDKGTKLKEINEIIDRLLHYNYSMEPNDITVENTNPLDCPLVRKLDDMTVLTPHQGARKRSVDLANQQAFRHYASSRLLSKPKTKSCHPNQPYPSIFHIAPTPRRRTTSIDQVNYKRRRRWDHY